MRLTTPLLTALLAVAALGGALATTASAASPGAIIDDCAKSATGELQKTYAKRDLVKALETVDGDASEYTGCYDAINNALRASSAGTGDGDPSDGGTGGGTGGGDSTGDGDGDGSGGGVNQTSGGTGSGTGPTGPRGGTGGTDAAPAPAPAAPVTPQPGSNAPVQLAGLSLVPDVATVVGDDGHTLPPALIGFLALLAAGTLGVTGTTIGRRVLARRRA